MIVAQQEKQKQSKLNEILHIQSLYCSHNVDIIRNYV